VSFSSALSYLLASRDSRWLRIGRIHRISGLFTSIANTRSKRKACCASHGASAAPNRSPITAAAGATGGWRGAGTHQIKNDALMLRMSPFQRMEGVSYERLRRSYGDGRSNIPDDVQLPASLWTEIDHASLRLSTGTVPVMI